MACSLVLDPSDLPLVSPNAQRHPYIRQDLKDAQTVPLTVWLNTILHVDDATFKEWETVITYQKWFEDTEIATALIDYCRASSESERYEPFTVLCNRVVELGRGNIPGVSATDSYPIDDLWFLAQASHDITAVPEHDNDGAELTPAVVAVCKPILEDLNGDPVQWERVLHWWELRFVRGLIQELSKARVSEKMSALDPDSGLPPKGVRKSRRSTTAAPKKPRRPPRTCAPVTQKPPVVKSAPLKKGTKRLPVDDLREGLSTTRGAMSPGLKVGADGALQSGSYALKLLSCTFGARVHCLGTVVKDDKFFPWFYDADGMVYTTEFVSIIHDFEKFAAAVVAFARCTPEQLGFMPSSILQPPVDPPENNHPPKDLVGYTADILNSKTDKVVRVVLKKHEFSAYVLRGRRTFVYIAHAPALTDNNLIVKFSYQTRTRVPEQDLIARARAKGVKNLPEVHLWGDLWKLSDGVRQVFLERNGASSEFEDRTLRAIVYTQYQPLKALFATRCDLIPVMAEQIIDCLHDLRFKANILHRDVSVNNIMFEMHGKTYHFTLIDYDMGVVLPEKRGATYKPSSKHRTGTLPFMARELVRDAWLTTTRPNNAHPRHCMHFLWHDYESVFWVSLHCALALPEGLTKDQLKLCRGSCRSLEEGKLYDIAQTKNSIAVYGLKWNGIDLFAAAACLKPWFAAWVVLFKAAEDARTIYEASGGKGRWDGETCGGTLTRDIIKATLTPHMPVQQLGVGAVAKSSRRKPVQHPPVVMNEMRAKLRPRK